MDNTILQQGRFTSDGSAKILALRGDIDWMMVYNETIATASQTTAVAVKFYWQRGFADNAKWSTFKSNAANAANLDQFITSNGFSLADTSANPVGTLNATTTAISAAAIPVVSNSGTNALSAGDVVRIINTTSTPQFVGLEGTVKEIIESTLMIRLDINATDFFIGESSVEKIESNVTGSRWWV